MEEKQKNEAMLCPIWHTWGRFWRKEGDLPSESSPRGVYLVGIVPGIGGRAYHTTDRSEFIMATVLWTCVAFYLYFEIAIAALLCLPFIKPAK